MEIEILNPHVIKILMAVRREDSVNAIAKRTGLSYGWAYHWMQALAEEGVFERKGRKMALNEKSEFYNFVLSFIKNSFSRKAGFYYYALQLFGIKYCFTKTDAVYVWTKGGYNIARYRDYYPVFIKLRKDDLGLFKWYCKRLGLKIDTNDIGAAQDDETHRRQPKTTRHTDAKGVIQSGRQAVWRHTVRTSSSSGVIHNGIFYSVELLDDFVNDACDGIPVDSLEETIAYMKKHIYNFEPALEMVHETYGTERHDYREAKANV